MSAITTPRPPDAPVAPAPGGAGGGAGGAGGGAGGNAGGDAGGGGGGAGAGGGVIAPVAPAGPPVRTPAQVWDLKNERVFMYLLMCTEGDANATVSQFCGTRHGADAWQALLDKYDPQGQLGITLTSSQLTNLRYKPGTDPDLMFMEAERLNARLTALGQPFPEQALVGMLLSKLPREIFGYLTAHLDLNADVTYAQFKTMVRTGWRRYLADKEISKLMSLENSMKALVVGSEKGDWRSKMRCFKCHQVGHPKRECPLLGGESEGAKKSGALTLSTGSGAKKPKTGMPSKPIPVPKKGTTFKGVPLS